MREDLNRRAPRAMAVLRPVRLVIENYPEGQVEELEAVNNPEDASMGVRKVPFSRVLWVERDDVREVPPPKYFRLFPGNEVRLRYAYIVRCTGVVKDPRTGEIVEVRCTYDPASRGGHAGEGRRIKGTIHWVSAAHAVTAEARLYDRLFTRAESRQRVGRAVTSPPPSIPPRWKSWRMRAWSRAWPAPRRGAASSSSGWATSASIRTRRPTTWS